MCNERDSRLRSNAGNRHQMLGIVIGCRKSFDNQPCCGFLGRQRKVVPVELFEGLARDWRQVLFVRFDVRHQRLLVENARASGRNAAYLQDGMDLIADLNADFLERFVLVPQQPQVHLIRALGRNVWRVRQIGQLGDVLSIADIVFVAAGTVRFDKIRRNLTGVIPHQAEPRSDVAAVLAGLHQDQGWRHVGKLNEELLIRYVRQGQDELLALVVSNRVAMIFREINADNRDNSGIVRCSSIYAEALLVKRRQGGQSAPD